MGQWLLPFDIQRLFSYSTLHYPSCGDSFSATLICYGSFSVSPSLTSCFMFARLEGLIRIKFTVTSYISCISCPHETVR